MKQHRREFCFLLQESLRYCTIASIVFNDVVLSSNLNNSIESFIVFIHIKQNEEKEKQKEEQIKYGIYFDDEYNYLQHMRDTNTQSVEWEKVEKIPAATPSNLKLPSSVFASEVEEDVGLLNKAAPHSGTNKLKVILKTRQNCLKNN